MWWRRGCAYRRERDLTERGCRGRSADLQCSVLSYLHVETEAWGVCDYSQTLLNDNRHRCTHLSWERSDSLNEKYGRVDPDVFPWFLLDDVLCSALLSFNESREDLIEITLHLTMESFIFNMPIEMQLVSFRSKMTHFYWVGASNWGY